MSGILLSCGQPAGRLCLFALRLFASLLLLLLSAASRADAQAHVIGTVKNVRFQYVINARGGDEYQIYITGVSLDHRKSCHLFTATATSTVDGSQYSNSKLEGAVALMIPGTRFPVTLTLTNVRVALFDDWYKKNQESREARIAYGNPCTEMEAGETVHASQQIMYASGQPCDGIPVVSRELGRLSQSLQITPEDVTVKITQDGTSQSRTYSTSRADIDRDSFHVEQENGQWRLTFRTRLLTILTTGLAPVRISDGTFELACRDNGDMGHVVEMLRNPDLH
ncbi:hypothetical protein [Burkholderia pseudomallei]|uniref:hypothetical protein n=1 Tax=Burkholderia pseudomallei TaxID=28450 RepID=UPI0011C4E8E9|nr:hypothetical protein [Burkholderia pseudomallei]